MPRLTVLGGSAANMSPGQGCSSYLLETDTTRLLIDHGPGTTLELLKHTDIFDLSGIVISHLHADHVLDLITLRGALRYGPRKLAGHIPLWLPPEGMTFVERTAQLFAVEADDAHRYLEDTFDIHIFDPNAGGTIGDIGITFHSTVHYIPCWAMRFAFPTGGDLFYTADTGPTGTLHDAAAGCEIMVAESTTITPADMPLETRGHLTATEAGQLANRAHVSRLLLTHIGDPSWRTTATEQAAASFSGPIEAADPGVQLSW